MDYDDEASDTLFLDAMDAIVLLFGAEPDDDKLAALGTDIGPVGGRLREDARIDRA